MKNLILIFLLVILILYLTRKWWKAYIIRYFLKLLKNKIESNFDYFPNQSYTHQPDKNTRNKAKKKSSSYTVGEYIDFEEIE